MEFISGTNLSSLWNDKDWITDLKREKIFEQIAGELAAFEFDQIGRLDILVLPPLYQPTCLWLPYAGTTSTIHFCSP